MNLDRLRFNNSYCRVGFHFHFNRSQSIQSTLLTSFNRSKFIPFTYPKLLINFPSTCFNRFRSIKSAKCRSIESSKSTLFTPFRSDPSIGPNPSTYPTPSTYPNHSPLPTRLDQPHLWYPLARLRPRTIHLHCGPTNSGKTHAALTQLKNASSGVYCAPLRLLAEQVFESLIKLRLPCHLITGERRIDFDQIGEQAREKMKNASLSEMEEWIRELYTWEGVGRRSWGSEMDISGQNAKYNANSANSNPNPHLYSTHHTSCTIEMLNLTDWVDCIVIDEYQMCADTDRGWAWTRAILGACATNLHLCGDESAIQLVQSLLLPTLDQLLIHRYNRLSTLSLEPIPLNPKKWIPQLTSGDAIIVFSRRDLFKVKQAIESYFNSSFNSRNEGIKVSTIYGHLPCEIRSLQINQFNQVNGVNGCNILVATDAIGLGLNLNIRRIIFYSLEKFDGKVKRRLENEEIKQISGRAGRYKSIYPRGYINALGKEERDDVKEAIQASVGERKRAGLMPTFEHLENLQQWMDEEMGEKGKKKKKGKKMDSLNVQIRQLDKYDLDNSLIRQLDQYDPDNSQIKQLDKYDLDNFQIKELDKYNLDHLEPGHLSHSHFHSLHILLILFQKWSQLSNDYFLCDSHNMTIIAKWMDRFPLTLHQKYIFSLSPIDIMDSLSCYYLIQWAKDVAQQRNIKIFNWKQIQSKVNLITKRDKDRTRLIRGEKIHKVIELYIWLSYRFTGFKDCHQALAMKRTCQAMIQEELDGNIEEESSYWLKQKKELSILKRGSRKRSKRYI